MTTKPTYPAEYRASAIIMLEAAGWPDTEGALSRVARHLGIPKMTLLRWARKQQNPPPAQLVTQLKASVTDLLDDIIYGAAAEVKRRIDTGEIQDAALSQVVTALGIAVDKRQLLTGGATERTESRSVTVNWHNINYREGLPNPDAE